MGPRVRGGGRRGGRGQQRMILPRGRFFSTIECAILNYMGILIRYVLRIGLFSLVALILIAGCGADQPPTSAPSKGELSTPEPLATSTPVLIQMPTMETRLAPTVAPTAEPTATPELTSTPQPTPTPEPPPSPTSTPEPTPESTPDVTAKPVPTLTPTPTPEPMPKSTPTATATPVWTPEPGSREAVGALSWIADGVAEIEKYGATGLRNIAGFDRESSAVILNYSWVNDRELEEYELDTFGVLAEIMNQDPEMLQRVLEYSWVADGITTADIRTLVGIRDLSKMNLELAWHVVRSPFMEPPLRQRDEYAVESLYLWSLSGPPPGIVGPSGDTGTGLSLYEGDQLVLAQIVNQPWFMDGLDDDEAALVHAIRDSSGEFQQALIETNYVESAFLNLPLSGDVGISVVRHTPFPPDDYTLSAVAHGIRVIEDFMGAPLPLEDVILLLVEPEFWDISGKGQNRLFCSGGGNVGSCYLTSIIRIVNLESGPPVGTIFHELGHYYVQSGARWLREGTANFLEAYTKAQSDGEELEERLEQLESTEGCAENIWEHVNPYRGGICDYRLGERFILGMYATLGREVTAAALRELHAEGQIFEQPNHDSIFHAFNSKVPPGKEEEFRSGWLRYHGSPVVDRVVEDSPDYPPLVALYSTNGGENWVNDRNWVSDAPLGAWHGVYTNTKGQVIEVALENNGLSGPILPVLGGLTNLLGLILSENDLTGEIIPELGSLTNLVNLDLRWNRLTGEIPPELGNLTELVTLDLGNNQLTGEIPTELGNLTELRDLHLQENSLSGEIPVELANLAKLRTLWLRGNDFTGCIAEELPEIWVEKTGLERCSPEE